MSRTIPPVGVSRGHRWTAFVLVALALATVLVAATSGARTAVALTAPVQTAISVVVPLSGILLVAPVRAGAGRSSLRPALARAVVAAVAAAALGDVLCLAAVGVLGPTPGRWRHLGQLVLGGVVVQLTAQLVGTGFGLLVRRRALAFVLTIVVPLGLWLLLGAVAPAAQDWLTPFASAQHQLSGAMTALRWAQTATVLLAWGAGLNLVGRHRLRRR